MSLSVTDRRIFVESRGGGLFAGDVRIYTNSVEDRSGARLDRETAVALGFDTWHPTSPDAHHFRGSWRYYRLHRCRICEQRFIAHHAARTCSEDCAARNHLLLLAKHRRPPRPKAAVVSRSQYLAERRSRLKCQVCGTTLAAKRHTKSFCSNRCRQRKYREEKVYRRRNVSTY